MALNESSIEATRVALSGAGPIPNAVLYNNGKDLAAAMAAAGVTFGELVPTGTISAFAGTTLPAGYLWCDGLPQLKSSYPDLWGVLGVNRYAADTATQFYTPNLCSHLPRGAATTAGAVTTNNNNTHGHGNNATTTTPTTVAAPSVTVNTTSNTDLITHNHNNNAVATNAANTSSVGAHNHNNNGANTGGPSATNTFRFPASGTLITVASSGHTHGVNGASTSSTGDHNHSVNGANAVAGTTANIINPNTTMQHTHPNSVSVVAGAVTMGTITTGTVIDNSTYVPAFVEVNYIIKT